MRSACAIVGLVEQAHRHEPQRRVLARSGHRPPLRTRHHDRPAADRARRRRRLAAGGAAGLRAERRESAAGERRGPHRCPRALEPTRLSGVPAAKGILGPPRLAARDCRIVEPRRALRAGRDRAPAGLWRGRNRRPPDLLAIVATPGERRRLDADLYGGRLLFVAKEAVYKAVFPFDRMFLEHHDVEVDIAGQTARIRNGRVVDLRFSTASRLVAVAFIRS
jgi:4'-phosphopantetheinyl transferase superfamily